MAFSQSDKLQADHLNPVRAKSPTIFGKSSLNLSLADIASPDRRAEKKFETPLDRFKKERAKQLKAVFKVDSEKDLARLQRLEDLRLKEEGK